ncbi:Demethylsterigmatocystin 6-O-methyltransferase [Lachnellula hyalina]|uniref:Demethylsterigmatocystin 6-O-methyltransferase n=1 Tax=Lachnellula hyalina TaxID=1316788 RepID=A0A8H8R8E0_9HELO|nr:Demethylsterigmatocystin 6-O-methyltransferase [Lachnellula hyalina]TVY30376.1 Demethylsterigmatocystin 6-O-methyltransferase [Lachnellula hyalina]
MDSIKEQVEQLARAADEAGRERLSIALRDLSYSLEAPKNTITRIISYPLRTSAVRTGIDLGIFTRLAASEGPLEVGDLTKDGADSQLVGRYLRYFASFGMVSETAKNIFAANNVTKVLADPGKEACVIHYFDTVAPAFQSAPAFLRETAFQNPANAAKSPFQLAYKTPLTAFQYFPSLPAASLAAFARYQALRSIDMSTWLSVYPFLEEVGEAGKEEVVFVDVGGGIGHQCAALREKYPQLRGRVQVQDLEHFIAQKVKHEGVEGRAHNIFEEQPIQGQYLSKSQHTWTTLSIALSLMSSLSYLGARFYYLRAVLHDFPDIACQSILSRLKDVMGHHSRILIDEMVLPNWRVDWAATHTDLTMMACFAAKERTQEQWESLLSTTGLKIEAQRNYTGGWGGYEAIITVAKEGYARV